ncbi:hypothetical protein HYFRA_00008898 [Hymenoscyphus fraxineus]|uniref:Uncharacterized protein n=1 Tax=Hymenoscyphus fraxineus TaxID=746836 RepID=A0A9N9L1W0_9HELO|nr:hypothetical protein HYFRA_00008898 [Hymenoscyphus fraxineus]
MKPSIVIGSLLIAAPGIIATSYFPRIIENIGKSDVDREEADVSVKKRFCSDSIPLSLTQALSTSNVEIPAASEGTLKVLKDKIVASLGPFQESLTVEPHADIKARRDAEPVVSLDEASSLQKWLHDMSSSSQHAEISRAFMGSNSRIMGRDYDGADDHRVVLSKYIDIIRNCPMFSSPSTEEISIPQGELDDNNWCRVAFGDVVLGHKDTASTIVSKFKEWKEKLMHLSLKTKRDRGFTIWDFGEPMEKREDFWTQIVETPEQFKITEDSDMETKEHGGTFEKRDDPPMFPFPESVEKAINALFEDVEKNILYKHPYESDYKRKEAWEKFQAAKTNFKNEYYKKAPSSSHHKRDWFDDLQDMARDFTDRWDFLDREANEKEKDEKEVKHWNEDWEKMKNDFLEEWSGDHEKEDTSSVQKRGNFWSDRGDPWNRKEEDTPEYLRPPHVETTNMLEPWKRSWWCPWCADPIVEEPPQTTRHEIFPGIEIEIPVSNGKQGDTAPSGWLWDEIREGLINIGGTLENLKNPSVEPQNMSPATKEHDEVGDSAPSGWLWNEIRNGLVNIEGHVFG